MGVVRQEMRRETGDAMMSYGRGAKRILSYFLMAGGTFLLFLGAHEWLHSRIGQNDIARRFDASTAPPRSIGPQTGDAVAKLVIPRLEAALYVVEGDGPDELSRGPGHLQGTAMPGEDGNCVIAGHRDTHFRILKNIQKGDDIILETSTGKFHYQVQRTEVVSPDNTASLRPTRDGELNLITCYPFFYVGSAPKRFVVQAQLLSSPAAHT
jgi:LPXTG-site transpeptidase (sortase) family protein